ncbi:MAG: hypothetical protein ABFD18_08485 [Syntrophomonas sp.]
MSRLLRGLLDTAPSAAIIKKLASQAANGVGVQDLLLAAGYIDSPSNDVEIARQASDKCRQMQAWEKVIEEAAQYNISPEVASELFRTIGQSMEKIKKRNNS